MKPKEYFISVTNESEDEKLNRYNEVVSFDIEDLLEKVSINSFSNENPKTRKEFFKTLFTLKDVVITALEDHDKETVIQAVQKINNLGESVSGNVKAKHLFTLLLKNEKWLEKNFKKGYEYKFTELQKEMQNGEIDDRKIREWFEGVSNQYTEAEKTLSIAEFAIVEPIKKWLNTEFNKQVNGFLVKEVEASEIEE